MVLSASDNRRSDSVGENSSIFARVLARAVGSFLGVLRGPGLARRIPKKGRFTKTATVTSPVVLRELWLGVSGKTASQIV